MNNNFGSGYKVQGTRGKGKVEREKGEKENQ